MHAKTKILQFIVREKGYEKQELCSETSVIKFDSTPHVDMNMSQQQIIAKKKRQTALININVA